jgi:hypothetical protein
MNNPVNMWDPTGNVPSWVGDSVYYELMPDNSHVDFVYYLQDHDYDSGEWKLVNQVKTSKQITNDYKSKTVEEWVYKYINFSYDKVVNEETGETEYVYSSHTSSMKTYTETDYHYKTVIITAAEKAAQSQAAINQLIKDRLGDPPKNTDPPAFSISTLDGKLIDGDEIILSKTSTKPSEQDRIVTSALQNELNKVLGINLTVDGWYGNNTANAIKGLQGYYGLPQTGTLDARTFVMLEKAFDSNVVVKVMPTVGSNPPPPIPNAGGTGDDKDIKIIFAPGIDSSVVSDYTWNY